MKNPIFTLTNHNEIWRFSSAVRVANFPVKLPDHRLGPVEFRSWEPLRGDSAGQGILAFFVKGGSRV